MPTDKIRNRRAARTVAGSVLLAGAVVGAVALVNALIYYRTPPLETALDEGDVRYFPTPNGDIFYQVAGEGSPLLLIHGIGAGESSYEFRHVFAGLARAGHRVYAIDLIGFGKSDKPDIDYTANSYIDLIESFLREVIIAPETGGPAVDVIASSLSGAYAVAVADRQPGLVRSLILIGPTGIESLETPATPARALLRGLCRTPVLGPAFYNAVASRLFIRYYLKRMIYRDARLVREDVVERYHAAAHQPGGDRVLPSFLTGFLNRNIGDAWARLSIPTLLIWGVEAVQTPPTRAQAFLDANPGARLAVIDYAGALPHDEQPDAFLRVVKLFMTTCVV